MPMHAATTAAACITLHSIRSTAPQRSTAAPAPSATSRGSAAARRGSGRAARAGLLLQLQDASFDALLHIGGINFINDKAKAIAEMIRVARPVTRIVICDENCGLFH